MVLFEVSIPYGSPTEFSIVDSLGAERMLRVGSNLADITGESQWTGAYVMEFRDLIASTPSVDREKSEEARFSFIQGGYVEDLDTQDDDGAEKDEILSLVNVTEKALQVRDEHTGSITGSTAKFGAEYFASRSYHGLDINSTDSLPGKFLAGRSGKASGYNDEKEGKSNEIAE